MSAIIIIGAGLAGMSAALTLAEKGRRCILVSASPSERAQSNLAAGGINSAAGDPASLALDTQIAGEHLGNRKAIQNLADHADEMVEWLRRQGVPFQTAHGKAALRKMGGHRRERTCYAGSITGKAVMSALIDQVRRYEAEHLIERRSHHTLEDLSTDSQNQCTGCTIRDRYTDETETLRGQVILASGGMSGLFPGHGTGVRENDADAAAIALMHGVKLGNLEFIQYHPTTIVMPGRQCLLSEAARSEGGRIFMERRGEPWYFLEEKYGAEGNLLCRDKIVREFREARQSEGTDGDIYLDMREIPGDVWDDRLYCLRELCMDHLNKDPKYVPIPIQEGMHYFMGGILTDEAHRTSMSGLYAAGECACLYHGANRLGGNSLLGAVYGGKRAALSAMHEDSDSSGDRAHTDDETAFESAEVLMNRVDDTAGMSSARIADKLGEILYEAMDVVRTEEGLRQGYRLLSELQVSSACSRKQKRQILLGMAMVQSALSRKESRGAHIRADYPEMQDEYQQVSVVCCRDGELQVSYMLENAIEFPEIISEPVRGEAYAYRNQSIA